MKTTYVLLFLLAGSLFAAEPFVGTWKLNGAKSKWEGGPVPPAKEETVIVTVVDGQFSVTDKGIAQDGSPMLMKYTVPTTGGPIKFTEGGPPAESGITSIVLKRRAGSKRVETQDSKDGKVYESGYIAVSADGKTLRAVAKGIDPQGKKYENVGISEKQ